MSADRGGSGGRDANIGAWLPIIGGVVVGAGILTVVYLFSKSGREPKLDSKGPEPKEQPKSNRNGNYCPKIDPKRRRWPTKEEEEELKKREKEREKRCEEWRKQCLAIRQEEERKRQEECEMLRKQQREEQRRRQEECEMLRKQEEERRRQEECENFRKQEEDCEMEQDDDWCDDDDFI